ncbi:Cytochrome P450 2B19 [Cricetulus griseus]|uniref:Cytochrome P450 n=1 Tax=Cricetulus griseus TaxID=10029 RepID=G3IJW9_CRIGR|nr:Cytochrome P450 2B19 [Cricetulus griseus]
MEASVLLFLTLLLGFVVLLLRGHSKARGHLPPGPRPLPFLGNLLQMDRRGLLNSFMRVRLPWGLGLGFPCLCLWRSLISKSKGLLQALGSGVIFANGDHWKALRRFSLATMRDFGMGKRSVEERIQEEAQCLAEELRKSQAAWSPPGPQVPLPMHLSQHHLPIVFGERFDYKDRQFLRLLDLLHQSFSLLSSFSSQVFELFSGFLKYFPGTHVHISRITQEILDYIERSVEQHQETLDPSNPRDLIDTYLLRMEKEKCNSHKGFHHQNLVFTVLSLFFAGTETSSTTLRYGFLLMLKYPHVAEKVQKEIDEVIGSHRLPTLDDRTKMPYTDAVIHEIQRFSDLVPIGVPHKVTKDTLFRGYLLPKNTEVYPILSSALHDPQYFEQPDTFNPDRFLDANGALKKNEAFMPFSVGKRICLGEGIARHELFLFFTTLLQNFSLSSPVDPKDIDLSPKESGFAKLPPIYKICFLSR